MPENVTAAEPAGAEMSMALIETTPPLAKFTVPLTWVEKLLPATADCK